jgi:hypothetical protein
VLNRPNHGLPSVLLVLWLTVRANRNRISEHLLIDHCAPQEGVKDNHRDRLTKTLKTWLNFGLFEKTGDDILLSEQFRTLDSSKDRSYLAFRRAARNLVLRTEHPTAEDFKRAAGTLLASDIFGPHFSSAKQIEKWESTHLKGAELLFSSTVQWDGISDWMRFFELAWPVEILKPGDEDEAKKDRKFTTALMLDPTDAVKQELPNILRPNVPMAVRTFMKELAERVPILDNGATQKHHLESLRTDDFRTADPEVEVSPAVSLAIIRLEHSGDLTRTRQPDGSHRMSLLTKDFKPIAAKETTHIALPGRGAR